jgi:TRAP-type C4-dicarboxylate transport system substrate-binding protein
LSPALAHAEPQRPFFVTASPEGTPWAEATQSTAARVSRQSGGRFKIRAIVGGTAGDETTTARQCANGKIFMWGGSAGALATIVPELNALELPFLLDGDNDQVDAVLRDPTVLALLARILARHGLVFYETLELGWRHFAGPRPMRAAADFVGLHPRSQPNPIHAAMWRALGTEPREISVIETLAALQGKIVDAFDNSPVYMFATSWYQQVTHYTLTSHVYQTGVVVLCKDALAGVPAKLRAQVLAGASDERKQGNAAIRKTTAQVLEQLGREGVKLVQPTAAERSALAALTRPARELYRKTASPLGRELLEAIERVIKPRKS